ncbi:hypothetical protein NP493_1977g00003 [Ridgeia piscesae]|uniref:Uncharacterized protein n=1 Tax=Ridgeia piscesae TaxID=27915 RepID=A0AAD9JP83_RIDPI|nr:hypothetical protein NP493_1977g00003 [Ridgeia piscesae]
MQAGAEGARFLELTQDLFLTHVHVETTGENILDLILSTEPNMIDADRAKEPFSDHNIVTCDVIVSVQVKEWRETYYDYKTGNYEEMRTFLRDWEQALQNTNVNIKWDHFKAVVNSAVQRFLPISTKNRNRKPRWMSKRAEPARRRKYHMWKRYRETREYHLYEAYKRQRNTAQNEVKKAKRYYEGKNLLRI